MIVGLMIYREFMQPSSRSCAARRSPQSFDLYRVPQIRHSSQPRFVHDQFRGGPSPVFEPETLGAVRKIFLEVEQTARMSARDQVGHLPRLYRAVCPQLAGRFLSASLIFFAKSSVVSITKPSAPMEELTADQRAAELEKMGGWAALAHGARTRCREIFERHRNQVPPLVEEDLRSESTEAVRRGLSMAGGIRLTALFDQVVDAFHDSEESAAAYALRGLGDTRAIPILIAKHPRTRHGTSKCFAPCSVAMPRTRCCSHCSIPSSQASVGGQPTHWPSPETQRSFRGQEIGPGRFAPSSSPGRWRRLFAY